jgi:hypothetical protein
VAQFVEQDRAEEEERGHHCHEVRAVRQPFVFGREHATGERPDDQHKDDQPAPVDPDADAADAAELNAAGHRLDSTPTVS